MRLRRFVYVFVLALLLTSAVLITQGSATRASGTILCNPNLVLTKSSAIVDTNADGKLNPGENINYTIKIKNTGGGPATSVEFNDTIPTNTAVVPGSLTTTSGTKVSENPVKITGMSVNVGATQTVTFSVRVNSPLECTDIINHALAKYSGVTKCSNYVTDHVYSDANVCISKAVLPTGDVNPGDTLNYTLTLTNTGTRNATGVQVDDTIPTNTAVVPGSLTTTSGTKVSEDPVKITGMTVNVGATQTVTFSVKVYKPLDNGTIITNKGKATYDPDGPGGTCPKPNTSVWSNEVTNKVVSAPILGLVKAVSPVGDVKPGDTLDYTLTLSNTGDMNATGVQVDDAIPANTTLTGSVACSDPGALIDLVIQVRVTNITVNAGSSVTVTFSVKVDKPLADGTIITNSGIATYDDKPPVPSNEVTNKVVSAPILGLTKAVSPTGDVKPGDTLDYTLTLSNTGDMNATGVQIDDAIPANTKVVPGSVIASNGAVVTEDPVKVTGMTVNVGATQTVTFSVKVDKPLADGTIITNSGSATYDDKPPVPSNEVTNKVVSAPILGLTKAVSPTGDVKPGDTLDYTLTLSNTGDMNATGVQVDDAVPANTTLTGSVACSDPGALIDSAPPVKVKNITVNAGASVTVTFSVKVDKPLADGTIITNSGIATYADKPPVPSNEVTNTVQSRSDLDVTKAESETGDVQPGDEIDYTLTITNSGDMDAMGVVFEDTVPANTTLKPGSVSASDGADESTATLIKVTGITVPAEGGTVTITFGVTVNDDAPNGAIISNQGKVTYDPDGQGQLPPETVESNIVTATVVNAPVVPTPPKPPVPPTAPKKISTKWYLSEGYTGKDLYYPGESFDTYILIANATKETAKVEATFMREDTSPVVKNYEVAGESRYTIHLNEVEGCANHHISTRLLSTNGVDIAAERAMYFDYYGIPGGHDSIGVTEPSSTWFLPEGYTGDDNYPGEKFNTYVLLENPNDGKASVDVTFLREGTTAVPVKLTLDPLSRHTIKVDEIEGCENSHISTRVNSDVPVIAERAMYFNYYGLTGGHESIGAAKPETEWYMPEGYTGENNYPGEKFDTYVLLENPNDKTATANATFMREGGTPVEVAYNLLPQSRFTIRLDDVKGCENAQVATRIMSDIPVVAERAMYFNYHGKIDGHDSIAAIKGAHWILPEGYTGDANYPGEEFDAYVLLMNPNDKEVTAAVKFMSPPSGKGPVPNILEVRQYKLPANSRYTIHADEIPELANIAFSTEVTSMDPDSPIICERAMYFNYHGIKGGHDSIGYDP